MFPAFIKKNKEISTLAFLLIISILLMSLDVRSRGKISVLDEFLIDTASVIQKSVTYTFQAARDVWLGYIYLAGLREENARLQNEAAELREKIIILDEAALENQRLRDLLSFKETQNYRTVTAGVIGTSPTSLFRTITIGKGSVDGVAKGMPVVTKDGLVGRVFSSSAGAAIVLLITDRNSDVDAVVQRSRDRGVAEGGEGELLQFKYLSRYADIAPGDPVVTSGIGGIFPKGLLIGSVSGLDRKVGGGIFIHAEIKPAVDFSKIEEVLVITDSTGKSGV